MSLADQSQQWYPTSVKVTVFQAKNLRIKGKHGTNDAYAIMQVAKERFSTAVAEKSVSPVWKEEASFDLPLLHPGNEERCTLRISVMHRALVGLDKQLGQAVINLLDLHENENRNKTEWFKLLDKHGKEDKERGEVLLDIQFMRNNMTASMFDLSGQGKSRSRMGKLKDKIRGKKGGLSDSASAIVPAFSSPAFGGTQVMTDSEGEGEDHVNDSGDKKKKKKSKIKSLFVPKSNLQRNVSQSMFTLGSSEKNSTLSGSRSSGLNVESPEGKKKFKFLTHKRTGSSDSKSSFGAPFLLGRSKQEVAEQSGVCINGSHVYVETPSASSTISLHSSDRGSLEDLQWGLGRSDLTSLGEEEERIEAERERSRLEEQEMRSLKEEQERKREEQEKKRIADEQKMRWLEEQDRARKETEQEMRRLEEEREMKRLEEEQERKREEQKKREEEEDMRRREEEEERRREEEQKMRWRQEKEEERNREEERRRDEEEMRRKEEEDVIKRREKEQEMRREEEEDMRRRREEEEEMRRWKEEEDMRREKEQEMREEKEEMRRKEEEEDMRRRREKEQEMRREEEEEMRRREEEEALKREEKEQEMRRQKDEEDEMRREEDAMMMSRGKEQELRRQKEEEEEKMSREEEEELKRREKEREMRRKKEEEEMTWREEEHELQRKRKEEQEMRWMKEEEQELKRKEEQEMRRMKEEEQELQRKREEEQEMKREEQELEKKRLEEAREEEILRHQKEREAELKAEEVASLRNPFTTEASASNPFTEATCSNPFEESPHSASASHVSRSARISAVKPRSVMSVQTGTDKRSSSFPPADIDSSPSLPLSHTFSSSSDSSLSEAPSLSPVILGDRHVPLEDLPTAHWSSKESLPGGTESPLATGPAATDTEKKRRAPLPPPTLPAPPTQSQLCPPQEPMPTPRDPPVASARVRKGAAPPKPLSTMPTIHPGAGERQESSDGLGQLDNRPNDASLANHGQGGSDRQLGSAVRPEEKANEMMTVRETYSGPQAPKTPFEDDDDEDDDEALNVKRSGSAVLVRGDPSSPSGGHTGNNHVSRAGCLEGGSGQVFPTGEQQAEPVTGAILPPDPPASATPNHSIQDDLFEGGQRREETVTGWEITTESEKKIKNRAPLPPGAPHEDCASRDGDPVVSPPPVQCTPPPSKPQRSQVAGRRHAPQPASRAVSGGRTLLQASVSPPEPQPITVQSGEGGGAAGKVGGPPSAPRRPHPVKPLSSLESHYPGSSPWGDLGSTEGKTKATDSMGSGGGPYSQLTHPELVSLVIKQQGQLSEKDSKIKELEVYIDNLLVRIIEEQPSILQSMSMAKKAI